MKRTRAMTLIETVVGLAILGTLVTSLVLARSRYLHQWALAGRKAEAIAATDSLLSTWWAEPMRIPRSARGDITEKKLQWQTHLITDPAAKNLGIQIIRVEVFDQQTPSQATLLRLTYVDIVLTPPQTPQANSRPQSPNDESAP